MNGYTVCRACGAQGENRPPMDTHTRQRVTVLLYNKIAEFLIGSRKEFSTAKGEREARERLEDVLSRPDVHAILDEIDPNCLRYSEFNGGMMLTPEEYRKQRAAMNPPDGISLSGINTQKFVGHLKAKFGQSISVSEEDGGETVSIVVGTGRYFWQHIRVKLHSQAQPSPKGFWLYSVQHTHDGKVHDPVTTADFQKLLDMSVATVQTIIDRLHVKSNTEILESQVQNALYFRLRELAKANGGNGRCSFSAKSERFEGINFNREGALNFAKTLIDLGFDSVTIELGSNSALVSWK